jgi:2-C-methyl-D-erythritol 4-phosphate cytidylyltransferase
MTTDVHYWLVMPAAGVGRRMQTVVPKQYLPLAGRTVIEWSLQPFIADPRCRGIMVALANDDPWWSRLAIAAHLKIIITIGGGDRATSVLNGLHAFSQAGVQQGEWVMVHDAARPCVDVDDLNALLAVAAQESVGALLAAPVTETIKRSTIGSATEARVAQTVSRDHLWRAQTPQLFRLGLLRDALGYALQRGEQITDESSAIELQGLQPRLVPGRADNLKVTLPQDLELAEHILAARR